MGHTRVIYTDSTTAECGTVLKMFSFEEDARGGCFVLNEDGVLKAYVLWGKADYYPDFLVQLGFSPRVQVILKTKDRPDRLDSYTREVVVALRNLDPGASIRVFDADLGAEISG